MELKFKVLDKEMNFSEQNLSESHVNKAQRPTYKEHLNKQIKLALGINYAQSNFKSTWMELMNYIKSNNFCHYKTLALRKGTKKLDNWLEDKSNKKPINNVAIIIKDNNLLKNNTIVFFVDYLHTNDLSCFELELKRIEFFDWNSKTETNFRITISNETDVGKIEFNRINQEELKVLNYDFTFDDDDYRNDPIHLNEWKKIVNTLNEKYNLGKDKKENKKTIFRWNKKVLLLLENDMPIMDKNNLQPFDNYNNRFLNEENKDNSKWSHVNCQLWETKEFEEYVNEHYKWDEENKKSQSKINELREKIKDLEKQKNQDNNKKQELEEEKKSKEDEINKIEKKYAELKKEKANFSNKKQKPKEADNQEEKEISSIFSNNRLIECLEKDKKKLIEAKEKNIDNIKILESNLQQTQNDIDESKKEQARYEEKVKINNERKNKFNQLINELKKDKIKIIKEIKNNKFKIDLLPSIDKFLEGNSSKESLFNVTLEEKDEGTKFIVKRFKNALDSLENGYYKNPLFFKSLRKPEEISISKTNQIPNDVQARYKLNEKQRSAVTKAINSDCVFYLQGPPGTGKTQTISAIVDCLVKENKKIVMTSSTHEAINNFFDRLNDNNLNNPNVLLLKYRANAKENDDEEYSEDRLFSSFKQKMIKNVLGSENNENKKAEIIKLLESYKKDYVLEVPNDYKTFICKPLCDFIFKNIKDESFNIESLKIDSDEWMKPIGYEKEKTKGIEIQLSKKIETSNNKDQLKKFEEIMFKIIEFLGNDELKKIDFKGNYLKELYDILKKEASSNKLEILLSKIKESRLNDDDKDFIDYVKERQLINVIGVTTTSKNTIEIGKENVDLYSQYPIDYLIIDEISKSSMPEIISKAILAKKIIFAGDYLQLPPQANINTQSNLDYLAKKLDNLKDKDMTPEEMDKIVIDLYKKSFFSAQVKLIQSNNNKQSIYEFLNESHRFGEEILKIVNFIYPNDEKLKLPQNNQFIQKRFNITYNQSNKDNPVLLVNLTKPTHKFLEEHNITNIKNNEWSPEGFDQKDFDPFKWKDNKVHKTSNATYNQYSAYVIVQICKKIIEENSLENLNSKIGIITLTTTQKEVVSSYVKIHLHDHKRYIKVDTIDNFQGREEDIIIVDFIRGLNKFGNYNLQKCSKRNLSFLAEKERINVAVSRAKHKLIIVGQFEYLKKLKENEVFSEYYNMLKESSNSYLLWGDECENKN